MSTIPTDPRKFRHSRTHHNLLSALHGEAQAIRRYLTAAALCERSGLFVAAHAFRFTAAQEKEHAAVFHGLLTAPGSAAIPAADAPGAPFPEEPLPLLLAAAQDEADECDRRYPAFARIAMEEGCPRIAMIFQRIAETERLHARRFNQYAQALQDGTLFISDSRTSWLCLPCGHLHHGCRAPARCDACGRDRGHFIRSDFYPFAVTA